MADCEFTAVTLGPLYDTFQLTSTPGGTWCASYLFSWLAKEIITNLVKGGIPKGDFIAPVFEVKEDGTVFVPGGEEVAAKGVGLFFDHIIVEGDVIAEATAARDKALATLADKIAEAIGEDKKATEEWVRQYFRIYIVKKNIPSNEGVIAAFGNVLSTLEYEPHYALQEDNNLLLKLFEDTDDSRRGGVKSRCLKHFPLVTELSDRWMLYGDQAEDNIRDIKSIADPKAQGKPSWKSEEYYCILNSDGDSMGKFFADCAASDAARELSQKSLQYCIQAAEMVLKYKGVPLYAGGDDLLAIVPVTGFDPDHEEQEITVFELINKLNTRFNLIFSEERQNNPGKPSISVGLSIQHIKSPLYEGLNRAFDLLHAAKNSSPRKNGLCVDLQKHSGQSFRFTVRVMSDATLTHNAKGDENTDCMTLVKLNEMIKYAREICRAKTASAAETTAAETTAPETTADSTDNFSVFLSSAGYTLETFAPLFSIALSKFIEAGCTGNSLKDFFCNMFDNAGQKEYGAYLDALREYCELSVKKDVALIETLIDDAAKDHPVSADLSVAGAILAESMQAMKPDALEEIIPLKLGTEEWEQRQKEREEAIKSICLNATRHCSDSIRVLRFMIERPGKEALE